MHVVEREIHSDISTELGKANKLGTTLVDGMAELQTLSHKSFNNFNDLGNSFLNV